MNLHLNFDKARCYGHDCEIKESCLRFKADNKGSVKGQISYTQYEPENCKNYIPMEN